MELAGRTQKGGHHGLQGGSLPVGAPPPPFCEGAGYGRPGRGEQPRDAPTRRRDVWDPLPRDRGGGGPFNNNNAENTRKSIEDEQLHLLLEWEVDVVVLARYMQVLSPRFLAHFPSSVINIHHSFLPAFEGGSPYRRAHERGVKLVGATAHYATAELDGGPIIEQDVHAVGHRDGVSDLIRKGRVLERNVLLRALEAHLDDRVIVCGNRCVVFGD